ncbi:MAG: DUF1957 domain-containing protein [Armatimonadetes bacterium]|nr:DUF1957 domain-containing protein [Armatimonadota bacterium]
MEKGYLCPVLHAHLPYVRHPEYSDSFEEDWFFEAVSETYLPILRALENLTQDNIDWRLTISITPTLMEMLKDDLLIIRYIKHLEKLTELAEKEVHRTKNNPHFQKLAQMYLINFIDLKHYFIEIYSKDLIQAFSHFQELGKLEIITCAATHGYLPLMEINPEAIRAQIKIGIKNYQKHLKQKPRGIWLPECGYNLGIDSILKDEGIQFFFTDTHGILYAKPRPRYANFAPIYCPSGVAAFGRDLESSKQVWSAKDGYPGDSEYREFYRDIGFDLDYDYIKPYIHESGERINTGIKYYRITGITDHKEPYNPEQAIQKAALHAGNFLFNREKQAEYLYDILGKPPIIVAPYDAELFGHWWFEGPAWLEFLFRKIHFDQKIIKLITPTEYLKIFSKNQISTPNISSWGYKGYHEVWLEGNNDWIYRHLHKAAFRMTELANRFKNASGILKRALNQASRELLLAQSSDWAFIMKTGTVVEYAHNRTKEHIINFTKLYEGCLNNSIDEIKLKEIEEKNNLFSEIDYCDFASI